MNVSQRLFEKVKDIWEECNHHPFIQELAKGTLPIEKFRFYMIQDHLYLMQYAKLFVLGLVKSKKEEDIRSFASLISSTIDTENAVHRDYLKRLGITREMIDSAKMGLLNESYTNYMLSIGFKDGLAEIAAAVLSCSWSYKFIGDYVKSVPSSGENQYFAHWIDEYTSEEYNKSNDDIINFINKAAENYSEEQLKYLDEIMINCSRYELMFWDMAYKMEY